MYMQEQCSSRAHRLTERADDLLSPTEILVVHELVHRK